VQACEMNRAIINKQVESYYFVEATWPDDLMWDIKTNYYYFPDGIPTCPVDFASYTLLASPYHRVTGHREGDGTHIF
jgi:general secretion pathway protein G